MLRVTVEIVPFGEEREKRTLGVCLIANTGTTGNAMGVASYSAEFHRFMDGDSEGDMWNVDIKGFHRKRGFWQLIMECLRKGHEKGHA